MPHRLHTNIQPNKQRIANMIAYVSGVKHGNLGLDWFEQHRNDIQSLYPTELFDVFHELLDQGTSADEILVFLDRITNVIYNDMIQKPWERPEKDSFLGVMMQENAGLVDHLAYISDIMKHKQITTRKEEFIQRIDQLLLFEDHYQKKENILFPMMEKKEAKFEGLSIMWALHDDIRTNIKEAKQLLAQESVDEIDVNIKVGTLFFSIRGLVIKEEMILFPTAAALFDQAEMESMYDQMFEYTFPFIDAPKRRVGHKLLENQMNDKSNGSTISNLNTITNNQTNDVDKNLMIHTSTGNLTFEQVEMLFNALPLDLSYVDENNKLRFFTKPKDRIFPRSPAAIGRDVKNCHPPKSVDVVMDIIEAFRSGEQDTASFWITLKGRFVLIQYFAVRSETGEYKGVLEASQDITDIKELDGERRLVSWGK